MSKLYPLRFEPTFRRYLWGGRRFDTVLNKPIGEGEDYAESWEVVDHGADQSLVVAGPLAGTKLHDLVLQQGEELLGKHHPQKSFPLLWKFLDAQKTLSLQVHPNDQQAARLDPPDLGKTEAWIILGAEPGSVLYAGLKPGVDRETLERALRDGTAESCLHQYEPQVGDCVHLEAGTVHAIGAGLLVAEIQQSSDTTYRLFDWNRVGTDGKPRELHIEQAMAVTDFERVEVNPQLPRPTDRAEVSRLAECEKYVLDRWEFDSEVLSYDDGRCHILSVVEGEVVVEGDLHDQPFCKGQSMLLPASCAGVRLEPRGKAILLDAYLP